MQQSLEATIRSLEPRISIIHDCFGFGRFAEVTFTSDGFFIARVRGDCGFNYFLGWPTQQAITRAKKVPACGVGLGLWFTESRRKTLPITAGSTLARTTGGERVSFLVAWFWPREITAFPPLVDFCCDSSNVVQLHGPRKTRVIAR